MNKARKPLKLLFAPDLLLFRCWVVLRFAFIQMRLLHTKPESLTSILRNSNWHAVVAIAPISAAKNHGASRPVANHQW